ncbi:hypothetical protein MegaChil _gp0288 [Megavirus chiliensis]|uniref:Uncharacterized protein mg288 n=1 Tax=Megavirus chiliensis TaxID=1094892 RepID=G5CS22_9VIRU|nr:hypothetical protein MegaChil _gp0288 [Megavirus chiliensis]
MFETWKQDVTDVPDEPIILALTFANPTRGNVAGKLFESTIKPLKFLPMTLVFCEDPDCRGLPELEKLACANDPGIYANELIPIEPLYSASDLLFLPNANDPLDKAR